MEFKLTCWLNWIEWIDPEPWKFQERVKEALFDFVRKGDPNLFLVNLNLAKQVNLSVRFVFARLMDNLQKSITLGDYT